MEIKKGDIFLTNQGGRVLVLNYRDSRNVDIEFIDSYRHRTTISKGRLVKGAVKNPYHPSVYGVGYMGVGQYSSKDGAADSACYKSWSAMMKRVYYDKEITIYYKDCSVVEEWHNFQNFAEWYYQQHNAGRKGFHLDKDLMVLGNRVYGPNFCSFIPQEVNKVLLSNSRVRGVYPQGISKHGNLYRVSVSMSGKTHRIGTYPTLEEALDIYKKHKEQHVKDLANKYKNVIKKGVYDTLINWEVPA